MNKNFGKIGFLGAVVLGSFAVSSFQNSSAQYDNTKFRRHDIKVVNRNPDFFAGDVHLNLEGGSSQEEPFYFSLAQDIADRCAVDRRIVVTREVVDFLLEDELSKFGGNFRIEWLPDRMGEDFFDSLRITSPSHKKQVEYAHQRNAIVSRVSLYDVDPGKDTRQILKNRKLARDAAYDVRNEDMVEAVTVEKDYIMRVGSELHDTCGSGCNGHLR